MVSPSRDKAACQVDTKASMTDSASRLLYTGDMDMAWCRDLGLQVKPLEGLTGQLVKNQLATRYRVARIATGGPPIVRGKIDR